MNQCEYYVLQNTCEEKKKKKREDSTVEKRKEKNKAIHMNEKNKK